MRIRDLIRGYSRPTLEAKPIFTHPDLIVQIHYFSCEGVHFSVLGNKDSAWNQARKLAQGRRVFKIGE